MTPVGSQLVAYVVEATYSKKPCLITHNITNFSERAKLNGLRTTKPFYGPKVMSCLSLDFRTTSLKPWEAQRFQDGKTPSG